MDCSDEIVIRPGTKNSARCSGELKRSASFLCGEKAFIGMLGEVVRTQQSRDFASRNRRLNK